MPDDGRGLRFGLDLRHRLLLFVMMRLKIGILSVMALWVDGVGDANPSVL